MAYVAADPNQPGAAWAVSVDDPKLRNDLKFQKHMAKTLADWVSRGAIIQHVPVETAKEMLCKWVRPSQPQLNLFDTN